MNDSKKDIYIKKDNGVSTSLYKTEKKFEN